MKTNVLGIQFDNLTREEARQAGRELLRGSDFHYVVTPNPEFLLAAEKDLEFQKILNRADLVLPDGIGVVYSAKILGTPLKERVAGFDFACDMLEELNELGGRLYLLGAKPGVADAAAEKMRERFPGLVIAGTNDGYFQDDDPVVEKINAAQPDLLLVCLGAPKQELWMQRNAPRLRVGLMAGLGGSLDVFAGNVKRAPKLFQKLGLEWFYRLLKEPKRIGRMMKLPKFLFAAIGCKLRGKKHHGEG